MVTGRVYAIENNDTIPLPYINVVAFQPDDAQNKVILQGGITDSVGFFSISLSKSIQEYRLSFSSIGYKPHTESFLLQEDSLSLGTIFMQEDTLLLNEVRIVQSLKSQSADNRTYIFTPKQKTKSIHALQLVSMLPGLRIDRTTNQLTPISGGEIKVLINGLPVSVSALRTLSPKNVKRVIYYDVPPAEYHTSGYLINLLVDYPEKSFSGDINLTAGNLYSSFDPVATYVSGRNMWTFELSSHWNPKNRFDYTKGTEKYSLSNENTTYNLDKKEQMHSISLLPSLSYLYNSEKVRIIGKAAIGMYNEGQESFSSYSALSIPNIIEQQLNSNVKNKNGSADLYVQYNLQNRASILFSSNFTFNDNQQELISKSGEDNSDFQDLKIDRKGFVNELVYRNFAHSIRYTSGIRSSISNTRYDNTQSPYYSKRLLNTLYSEFWGKIHSLEYRGSLFLNHELSKTPIETNSLVDFTPKWQIAYAFSPALLLRYRGNISARRPTSQELSNNLLKISPLMYRAGTPTLRNEMSYENELLMRVTKSKWQLDWSLNSINLVNPIILSYNLATIDGKEAIVRQPINGRKIDKYETSLYFNLSLFDDNLNFGLDTRLMYFILVKDDLLTNIDKWLPRISASLSYTLNNWSFEYYQILFGKEITNLIFSDVEKVSYVSVGYRKGNIGINASLFFPFGKDMVDVTTLQEIPYHSDYNYRMLSKEKTFAISLSWFFGDVEKRLNSNKAISNGDENKGVLDIK